MASQSPDQSSIRSTDEDKPVDVEVTAANGNLTEKKDPNLVEYDGPDDPVRQEERNNFKDTNITMNNLRATLKTFLPPRRSTLPAIWPC